MSLPCAKSQSGSLPLITKEEYRQLEVNGLLAKNKVCRQLLD